MNPKQLRQGAFLVILLLFPSVLYLFLSTGYVNHTNLPIKGPKEPVTTEQDGKTVVDTVYHTIPNFTLTNFDGRTITRDGLRGKVVIANFMFTRCKTSCPQMAFQLHEVQKRLGGFKDLAIVSHTVDPLYDTPDRLTAYADTFQADPSKWFFLTGEREDLYQLAKKGYLISAGLTEEDDPNTLMHSDKLVLLDREGRIRGFYTGTGWADVKELVGDAKMLLADKYISRKKKKRSKA